MSGRNYWRTLGLFFAGLVATVGTFWAFQRGAGDFSVFYSSWRLVATGQGASIYHATPDRFLYAPGFAWLFAPLALLPYSVALTLWCLAKAAVLGALIRFLGLRISGAGVAIVAWAVVFCARPLLIDFQYGQVNTFILVACVWALFSRFETQKQDGAKSRSILSVVSWFFLAIAAVAKVFPLPLLGIPWLVTRGISPRRLRSERIGMLLGIVIILLLPVTTEGFSGTWALLFQWKDALLSRGLPLETHNQSVVALLYRFLAGDPVHVVALGMNPIMLTHIQVPKWILATLASGWTLLMLGFLVVWFFSASRFSPLRWSAILISWLIVPSHLVWKPYFVMTIPVMVLALSGLLNARRSYWQIGFFSLAVLLMNFASFDFIGLQAATYAEAASALMLSHLILLSVVLRQSFSSSRSG